MDFSPRPKGFNTPERRHEFDETAKLLLSRAFDVCRHLLPSGVKRADEYECGSTQGERGKSLKINLREGLWKDFESGAGGSDLIALWAEVRGVKMIEAKTEAEAWLGIGDGRSVGARPVGVAAKALPVALKPAGGSSPPPSPMPTEDEDALWWRRVPPTKVWDYFTRDGELFGQVYRIEDPDGKRKKEIRPWNGRDWKAPEGTRPLFNLPAIMKAPPTAYIVLVEGEKCADAVNELGDPTLIATTCWGGAAAARHTDWTPLSGRHVLRWPDNDHPNADGKPTGRDVWLKTTDELLPKVNVASLRDLPFAPKLKDGWDAADTDAKGRREAIEVMKTKAPVFEGAPRRTVKDMTARALFFDKVPKDQEWLVENVFPLGRGGIFAAAGDTGKGMLMLDLAVKVATNGYGGFDASPLMALGHKVVTRGAVAILSGEDDADELHRRLVRLYPDMPAEAWDRLHFLPYPDMPSRTPVFLAGDIGEVDVTQEFRDVLAELQEIENLALTVVDPVSAFANVDMTAASASQIVGNTLDRMAKTLGSTVIGCHHLTKGDRRNPIAGPQDARHLVSGSGQLLNAVRFAYALWAMQDNDAYALATTLGRDFENNTFFRGAIVKSNAPSDRDVKTFARNSKTGLLEIVEREVIREAHRVRNVPTDEIAEMVVRAITTWNKDNQPVALAALARENYQGGSVVHLMPPAWQSLSVSRRKEMLGEMVDKHKTLVKTSEDLLAIPGDDWSKGPDGGGKSKRDRVRGGARKVIQ